MKDDLKGFQELAKQIGSKKNLEPIHNLEVGITYQYLTGSSDMFSKSFTFVVIDDCEDYYLIDIEGQYETPLAKTFEFIEAVNEGKIIRLGIL